MKTVPIFAISLFLLLSFISTSYAIAPNLFFNTSINGWLTINGSGPVKMLNVTGDINSTGTIRAVTIIGNIVGNFTNSTDTLDGFDSSFFNPLNSSAYLSLINSTGNIVGNTGTFRTLTLGWENITSRNLNIAWTGSLHANNLTGILQNNLLSGSVYLLNSSTISAGNITSGIISIGVLPTQIAYTNASTTFTVDLTVSGTWLNTTKLNVSGNSYFGSDVELNNNKVLRWTDSTGTSRLVLNFDGDNIVRLTNSQDVIFIDPTGGNASLITSGNLNVRGTWTNVTNLNVSGTQNVLINSPTFFIDTTNSRVGIGTATPQAILNPYSASDGGTILNVSNKGGGYTGTMFIVNQMQRGDTTAYNLMQVKNTGGTALFIDGARKVGIGTAAPASLLHAIGTGALLNVSNSTAPIFRVNDTSAGYVAVQNNTKFCLDGLACVHYITYNSTHVVIT